MNIKEQIEQQKGLVLVKNTSDPNLFVLKYHSRVFYEDKWDDFLRECRGLIIDSDYNIVTYPFTKIHNFRKEEGAPEWEDDVEVDVVQKINGFMVAMTVHNGELLVSTTGSIDSDFAKLARSHVSRELEKFLVENPDVSNYTFMFECCDPSDPHIIDEEPGLYFLGCRENVFGSEIYYNPQHQVWNEMGVKTIPVRTMTVGEVKEELKTCRHEGYVMYLSDPEMDDAQEATKWKSPYYLTKKLFMRGNIDKLLAKNIKQGIDEEYYPLVDAIKENRDAFSMMSEAERKVWIEEFLMKL